MERFYDTWAASAWYAARGIKRSPSYLRKLRTLGTGPAYRTLNGRVYYTEPDMTQDIEERLSPPRRSSSEPDQTPTAEPMPANHRSQHGRLEAAEASPAG